ncbi:MAG: hypothetical protein K2K57_10150 [Oscillospiraceae bacterium]|nr:hypothetical protein [Oscillospiraceae bacterium]
MNLIRYYFKKIAVIFVCVMLFLAFTGCNRKTESVSDVKIVDITTTSETETSAPEITYIINKNTKKFHDPDCPSVYQIYEKNKSEYTGDRDSLISKGYKPCKKCEP